MRKRSRRILKKFHEDIRDLFSIVILKNINKLDDWHCPMSVLWAESLSVYIHVVYARPGCTTGHFAQDLVGYATARLDWIRPYIDLHASLRKMHQMHQRTSAVSWHYCRAIFSRLLIHYPAKIHCSAILHFVKLSPKRKRPSCTSFPSRKSSETNKNLAFANRSRVSCAHNMSRSSMITPWPWNLG